jgi:superfamily II DNA or RNA helicase
VNDYGAFLAAKAVSTPIRGMAEAPQLAGHLFAHQSHCVEFALRVGSSGCFLDTGLGKTAVELEFLHQTLSHHNGYALILTPLAVARQIAKEGRRWGYDVRVIREQVDAKPGINICNYDRLDLLEPSAFGAIAIDESSILKAFTGKTTRRLIESFAGLRWRMAATATPAPNDHVELAQHSEFLGLMARDEMLVRWFINDGSDTKSWRLKRHGVLSFFDWMSSWSRMAEHPRDLGFEVDGFDLPPLKIHRHHADTPIIAEPGSLFANTEVSATEMHAIKRQTAYGRADRAAELVTAEREPWVIWCDTDYEADALLSRFTGQTDVVEVRGSHSIERKESALAAFADGTVRVIITKASIAGHGLNWQHCSRMVFVGRSFSYESWYQAVRRSWRFGQKSPVNIHLIVADGEDAIGRVIDRKTGDHIRMKAAMVAAMHRDEGLRAVIRNPYNPTHAGRQPAWLLPENQ